MEVEEEARIEEIEEDEEKEEKEAKKEQCRKEGR
jgi:hypothetical protein